MANNENLDALSHSRPNIVDSKGEPLGKARAKNAKTSKIFFIGIILFLFCCVIYLFSPFWTSIAIGVLLAVSTCGLNVKILNLTNQRTILSAILTTIILCLLFFVPFVYATIELAKYAANTNLDQANSLFQSIKNLNFTLPQPFDKFENNIRNFIANLDFSGIAKHALSYVSVATKSSAKFAIDMIFIVIFYFFANLYGKDFINFIKKSVPIDAKQIDYIFSETANTMSVVLYSTIFNAVFQGFLFSTIASIYGFDRALMWIVFSISSLIPAIGGAIIYIPTALYIFFKGDTTGAIIIVIYSVVMISIIADSFIKPLIIKFINSRLVTNHANINEMLIFFSMLAGISTFGFWGVILGPAILTLFIAILNLYSHLRENDFTF